VRFSSAAVVASLLACAKGAPTALPAEIIYATPEGGLSRLYATPETPGATRTPLTPAAQRAAFVGALGETPKDAAVPATRALQVIYALVADDASLTSLRKIGIDGKADVALADLPAATWTHAAGTWQTQDGTILVQLSRIDGSGPSLLAVRDGGASVLASGQFLAMAGNRVAYLANSTSAAATVGDVRSVGADGSANLALGGGDADDLFHGVAGDKLLFTAHHTKTTPELRITGVDGVTTLSRAGSRGLLLSGSTVVAARADGFEKIGLDLRVSPVSLLSGAQVLALLADGRVAAFVKGAGVMAGSQVLDNWAADTVVAPHQFGDRLVYTMNSAGGSYLRSAKTDGSGATGLSEGHGQELLFEAELPGNRALFYRTKGTEPGGWLASVPVTGGAEALLGDDITGTRKAADQDMGGLTRAGRLVFEAELFEHAAPRLFIADTGGEIRGLTPDGSSATLSAVLE
jgi:hypothetical protein